MPTVHLLDYVAGNIRSLVNAIEKCGYEVSWIKSPDQVQHAEKLILPGVGHFGHCLTSLSNAAYLPAIREHIANGKPFFGICVGLQALFDASQEAPEVKGLGVIPGKLTRFSPRNADGSVKSVPCIGWNSASTIHRSEDDAKENIFYGLRPESKYYYVHSYAAPYDAGLLEQAGWTVSTATYGDETYVGAVGKGNVFATQFHPEKSGAAGLRVIKAFLDGQQWQQLAAQSKNNITTNGHHAKPSSSNGLTRRLIACLDVRTNDAGDLVVTKGDQYDVRDKTSTNVRNLGKPVELAQRYYAQGADEITFLNITSFRSCPIADLPMLEVLRRTSTTVFVPLTVGGGIRDTVDPGTGQKVSALEVASLYFKSGADKVSIGSDAVAAAQEYYASGRKLSGNTAIEQISRAYGAQAVVVSVDPKRVFVRDPAETSHHTIKTAEPDADGREWVWYACTVKGGREQVDMDVRQLVRAVEAMGAGEILLNAIDRDGSNRGFDLELVRDVKASVGIPVIASSGAGRPAHFEEVFVQTETDAALGAGMFHRGEYTVEQVKGYLQGRGLLVRPFEEM